MSNIDKHPLMTFARENYTLLDGKWSFAFDPKNCGIREKWYLTNVLPLVINVPYVYQCEKSGIFSNEKTEIIWYQRKFEAQLSKTKRTIINFGAVDYKASVWINGELAGEHEGGYTAFRFDITELLKDGENTLTVRVFDGYSRTQIRGKQYCSDKIDRCFYEASSGIWQSVWLEETGLYRIETLRITPSIKERNAKVELKVNEWRKDAEVDLEVVYKGKTTRKLRVNLDGSVNYITLDVFEEDFVDELHYWSPEKPELYDVKASLICDGKITDEVMTYFGMREIEIRNGYIYLNNSPIYQKLVLAQGYFEGGLYTATDEELKKDIEIIKSFGFNGVRMHQKIENPRFYYWADKLGLLVWGEMPSNYQFCSEAVGNMSKQTLEFIDEMFNCPSIIAWIPFNESWGIRNVRYDKKQQNFVKGICSLIKATDSSRLVGGNDGWEIADGDFISVHNYFRGGERFTEILSDDEKIEKSSVNDNRALLCDGEKTDGRPLLLTEYGGISRIGEKGWGYSGVAKSEDEFIERFADLHKRIYDLKQYQGFCYTQFTDVYQETNGLTDMSRRPKVSPNIIKQHVEGSKTK